VDKDASVLTVKTVSCSTNCFPKPRGRELSKSYADEWQRFDVEDVAGIREFVSSLSRSYAGRGCFELSRLTGEQAWRRWRTRFKRAGGPDIGSCPGAVTWDDAPTFIADPWPATIEISSGQPVTPELAEILIERNVRVPITVVDKGAPFVLKEHKIACGAIGFISCGCVNYYANGKRRWGRELHFSSSDAYFRVATTVKLKPRKSDIIPHSKTPLSLIQAGDIVLRRDKQVLAISRWDDGFSCALESEIGNRLTDLNIAVFSPVEGERAARALNENFAVKGWYAGRWKP